MSEERVTAFEKSGATEEELVEGISLITSALCEALGIKDPALIERIRTESIEVLKTKTPEEIDEYYEKSVKKYLDGQGA